MTDEEITALIDSRVDAMIGAIEQTIDTRLERLRRRLDRIGTEETVERLLEKMNKDLRDDDGNPLR